MNGINVFGAPKAYTAYEPAKAGKKASAEKTESKNADAVSAVYEKSEEKKLATYKINRMSSEDRAALVSQLKQDQANRLSQLTDIASKMMTGQALTYTKTDESMWKFLADGKFTVDAATKAKAEEDISEDGYWGVKQTAQRLFDFASALAGDDVDKMKEMQSAMEKGFKRATKTWGRELPEICGQTMDAANKLFSNYFEFKQEEAEYASEDADLV